MNAIEQFTALQTEYSPAGLLASLRGATTLESTPTLAALLDQAEDQYLLWINRRDAAVREIERVLANQPIEKSRADIKWLQQLLDDLITEDCEVAQILRTHFARVSKHAEAYSCDAAKDLQRLGERFFNLATRQIEAQMTIQDNLRALAHHYADTADKRLHPAITLEQAPNAAQMLKVLLTP